MSIQKFIDGYHRFRKTRFSTAQALYRELGDHGQSPRIMVIACCDSRVDPATIFDTQPGELFVLRNVANLVPPDSPVAKVQALGAALEFAVLHLKVEHIVVMGHAQCGGAKALLEGFHEEIPNAEYIGSWMNLAALARDRLMRLPGAPSERLQQMEYQLVRVSMENLLTYKWIRDRVEAGTLSIHGCHFGIAEGDLMLFDADASEFKPVLPEESDAEAT